jgi:hypothetical protein
MKKIFLILLFATALFNLQSLQAKNSFVSQNNVDSKEMHFCFIVLENTSPFCYYSEITERIKTIKSPSFYYVPVFVFSLNSQFFTESVLIEKKEETYKLIIFGIISLISLVFALLYSVFKKTDESIVVLMFVAGFLAFISFYVFYYFCDIDVLISAPSFFLSFFGLGAAALVALLGSLFMTCKKGKAKKVFEISVILYYIFMAIHFILLVHEILI